MVLKIPFDVVLYPKLFKWDVTHCPDLHLRPVKVRRYRVGEQTNRHRLWVYTWWGHFFFDWSWL